MVSARIYLEGGGDTKEGRARCREGFRKLMENCGFAGRMPRLVACGSRTAAFDDFKTANDQRDGDAYVGLLVDSEEPVADVNQPWQHVERRVGDQWARPKDVTDEQLLLMTTSMETWLAVDRETLRSSFGPRFNEMALPAAQGIEQRDRQSIFAALRNASANCPSPYAKGPKSFELLGKLKPDILDQHLLSFRRARQILNDKLS